MVGITFIKSTHGWGVNAGMGVYLFPQIEKQETL
jgi:hypothetical protein